MKFLTKKIPIYLLIVTMFIGIVTVLVVITSFKKDEEEKLQSATINSQNIATSCDMNISRLKGYKFIKPLLFAERSCEAEKLFSVKNAASNIINNLKTKGNIDNASVYIRLFNGRAEWISINDEIKYQPGSLLKVPILITLLKMEEKTPGILQTKLTLTQSAFATTGLKQEFLKSSIKVGSSYTIKELLNYMIINSDNNATVLLNDHLPLVELQKACTDLGITTLDLTKSDSKISAKDYSAFWIALYNGSYLNFTNSEFALSLLSKTDFNEGMVKGLPKNIKISHKFGEKGDPINHTLSETGIVYVNNFPYLITIMTQGKNQAALPNAIEEISASVYNNIESLTH